MKKEFTMLFKKRYPYLIMLAVLAIVFILVGHLSFVSDAKGSSDSVYSDFIDKLEIYNTQEELQVLYNQSLAKLEEYGPGGTKIEVEGMTYWESPPPEYFVAIYKFLLDNNLPYDSLVEFENKPKYTPFHYFANYSLYFGYFILISSIIMGALFQTTDVMSKMAKMVYSTGEKRSKIIDAKYGVSMLALIVFTLLADIIMSISAYGLFANSDAKYCIMFTGSNLLTLSFFEFILLNVSSHLLIATLIYTINYYLSVMCKNGIIMLCANFSLVVLLLIIPASESGMFFKTIEIAFLGGFNSVLYSPQYYTEFKYLLLLIPYALIAVAVALISRPVIKQIDYSR
ncbi:MAG: hypothetical protein K2L52_03930 [Clostridia bacterium]|nr:hypothetical protein [Clostridia bacterium]